MKSKHYIISIFNVHDKKKSPFSFVSSSVLDCSNLSFSLAHSINRKAKPKSFQKTVPLMPTTVNNKDIPSPSPSLTQTVDVYSVSLLYHLHCQLVSFSSWPTIKIPGNSQKTKFTLVHLNQYTPVMASLPWNVANKYIDVRARVFDWSPNTSHAH